MAFDKTWAKRRWSSKQDAERKKAGEAVKVKTSKPPISATDIDKAAKRLQEVALRRVISTVPAHLRTQWPKGNCEWAETADTIRFEVILEHTSGATVSHAILMPKMYVGGQHAGVTSLGNTLGKALAGRVVQWHDDQQSRKEEDYDNDRFFGKSITEAVATATTIADTDGAKKLGVGTAGPFCIACGREDRAAFPDWGPCPHMREDK